MNKIIFQGKNLRKHYFCTLALVAMLMLFAFSAAASPIVIAIPSGTVLSGGPVSAQATFTIDSGTIHIVLENLQANPHDVAQNLSDLAFGLSSGPTSGTLRSSSGWERTVAANGTYTDGATPVTTGWALENGFDLLTTTGLRLHLLGTQTAPKHTIIGPPDENGIYSAANNSIARNRPHNPFLAGPVTFDLSVPGLVATDQITAVRFSFGTSEGTFFEEQIPLQNPEPTSLLLLGTGLGALGYVSWRKKK
jgi:hypothetical protein